MLLLPLLTRYLTPAEYGNWVLFVAISSFLLPVLSFSLQDAVRMRFFELKGLSFVQFVLAAMIIGALGAFLGLVAIVVLPDALFSFTPFPAGWLWSTVVVAYLYSIFYMLLSVLQFQERKKQYLMVQLMQTVLTLSLSLVFVLLDYGWRGVVVARIIGLLLANAWTIRKLIPELHVSLSHGLGKKPYVDLLRFGLLYLPAGVMPVLVPLTDRLFVAHMVGVAETSFFGIGGVFSQVLWLVVTGFIYAWQPLIFRSMSSQDRESKRNVGLVSVGYFLVLPVAGVVVWGIALLASEILVGPNFSKAKEYIGWLILAVVAQGYFQFNQTFLHAKQQVKVMSFCSLVAISCNVVFNVYLIRKFGGIGAAWATSMSFAVAAILNGSFILTGLWLKRRSQPG